MRNENGLPSHPHPSMTFRTYRASSFSDLPFTLHNLTKAFLTWQTGRQAAAEEEKARGNGNGTKERKDKFGNDAKQESEREKMKKTQKTKVKKVGRGRWVGVRRSAEDPNKGTKGHIYKVL